MQRRRSSANSSSDPLLARRHPGLLLRAHKVGKGGGPPQTRYALRVRVTIAVAAIVERQHAPFPLDRHIHSCRRDLGLGQAATWGIAPAAYDRPPDRKFPMAAPLGRQVAATAPAAKWNLQGMRQCLPHVSGARHSPRQPDGAIGQNLQK